MRGNVKVLSLAILIASCVCMATTSVRADGTLTLTETGMLNPIEGNFNSQLVTIPQFDPNKGTLCFVVVRISASYDATVRTENTAGSSGHISVMATQTLQVTSPIFVAPLPISNSELIPFGSKPVAAFDGTVDFMGPSSATFTYSPTNPREEFLINGLVREPSDFGFASFIGNGSYDFSFDGSGSAFVQFNTGGADSTTDLLLGAKVEVEYHYVPEPATLALLLPGLLLVRRRRSH
ncbi:hypothetical protein B7486_12770 [cyanobacterium TDX16]|nr:hypothetical protein B7486_12770 [cyanobacterium TDX16]